MRWAQRRARVAGLRGGLSMTTMAHTENRTCCPLPPLPVRELPPDMPHDRARAILLGSAKWVNGTVLHYYFFDSDADA